MTQFILDRMNDMVYQYNHTKVLLLIETNDIMLDGEEKKDETIGKIEEIIKNNRKKSKIYLESIYPVNDDINKTIGKR